MADNIDGTPASLVFIMDEVGKDHCIDTHSNNVIVQPDFPDKTIIIISI